MSLKKKARILLPDSCVLIGVIDPTDTLEEDEIFVQIRKDNFATNQSIKVKKNQGSKFQKEEFFNNI